MIVTMVMIAAIAALASATMIVPVSSARAAATDAMATAAPNPLIEEQRKYYTLDAVGVAGMRRQLDERGPRNRFGHPASGLTRHTITARYALWQSAGHCEIRDVRVHTVIEIHLPRWQPKREPPSELVEQWRRLETALTEHELGHRDNGVRASHELLERLRALATMPACRELERQALRVRATVMAELRAREDAYEARTDFGRLRADPKIEARAKRIREESAERERARARRLLNGF